MLWVREIKWVNKNKNKVILTYLQSRFEKKTLKKSQEYVEIRLYSVILM